MQQYCLRKQLCHITRAGIVFIYTTREEKEREGGGGKLHLNGWESTSYDHEGQLGSHKLEVFLEIQYREKHAEGDHLHESTEVLKHHL